MKKPLRSWLIGTVFAATALACNNPTVTTPTRTLDRPSDVALYCVDVDVPNCLPDPGNLDADPQGYLDALCSQQSLDYAALTGPSVTVLTLDECDDDHRRQRTDAYFVAVHRAVELTGRDQSAPCCPPDDITCGNPMPVCTKRVLTALISNTARGELAVADTQSQAPGLPTIGRLENLHSGQPGFGFLPTGLQPEHVRSYTPATSVGEFGRKQSATAWAATANAGSCDLSVVRLQPIADLSAHPANCDERDQWCPMRECDASSCPMRVEPWIPDAKTPHQPLRARPSWLEIAPWSVGDRRVAFVSYPTCGIVATVDLGSTSTTTCDQASGCGRLWEAVGFDATGKPHVLSSSELANLQCASDCGGDGTGSLMPDPHTIPDGGVPTVAAYPAAIGLDVSGQRLLIGNSVGDSITLVDFDSNAADGSHFRPNPRSLALDFTVPTESLRGGQPGVDTIRVSPRTPAGLFAYIVAHDSTIRVVDLDREVECETNPDPRYLQQHAGDTLRVLPDELNDSNLRRLGCLPVGPKQTPRSPLAFSPGITLPNGSLPRDVGFLHADITACDTSDPVNCTFAPDAIPDIWLGATASFWVGDFGWVLGGSGQLMGIQLADTCPRPSFRACFPDSAAERRVYALHTRSQAVPSPELVNLPPLYQAQYVTPQDRMSNVRRSVLRFENADNGPRTDADGSGIPRFTVSASGTLLSYFLDSTDPDGPTGNVRRRLTLPTPTSYYYVPVDPVCDVALSMHTAPENFASPGDGLPIEPTRRPLSMLQFIDPRNIADSSWFLDWEGVLPGLGRTTGKLLSDGSLIDLNGVFCTRGAESGDKLWLTGCQSDSDCLNGTHCIRESTQGINPGMCLTLAQAASCRVASQRLLADTGNDTVWAATWLRRYRVIHAQQQVTVPTGDTADRLVLDEIPEPEFELEQQSCSTLGGSCLAPIVRPGQTLNVNKDPAFFLQCRGTGYSTGGTLTTSCVLECKKNDDCGYGFVCAHSHYEADEVKAGMSDAFTRARCMRAPLITSASYAYLDGQPNNHQAEADALLTTCLTDQTRYEVHAGDSFMVHGNQTGSPTLVERAPDGTCQRPTSASPSYAASRVLQPRLRLGPRESLADTDSQRCSTNLADWILHRIPASTEAVDQLSCQSLWQNGGTLQLPPPTDGSIDLVHGNSYPLQGPVDAWMKMEYELFSSLRLEDSRNQCVLTGAKDEDYPSIGTITTCAGRICRFPGDHAESLGVRRIHFENALGNLVLRHPRVLLDPTKPYKECVLPKPGDPLQPCNPAVWAIPPDTYSINFPILGSETTWLQNAQSTQADVSSGLLAQGLKSATTGPSGSLFIVDEGRTGSLTGLRGQVLRVVGSLVDLYFLLR